MWGRLDKGIVESITGSELSKKQINFKTLENMPFGILPERCRIHPSLTKLKNGAEGIKIWLTKNPLIESIHQAKIQLRWPLKAIIC